MSLTSLLDELSTLASLREGPQPARPACVCNADSWDEICIKTASTGSTFFVCPACDPKRDCNLCNRTGHRRMLGQEVIVQKTPLYSCACMNVHHVVDLLNSAEIPDRYIKAKRTAFQMSHLTLAQKKILEKNIEQLMSFCENTDTKYFATLFGPVGSGKTLLATVALKKFIIKHKLRGKFIDFQYLLSVIRNQFDQNQTGEHLLNTYRFVDVLVIDEFAKGRMDKEWPLEKLDDLINYRYNHKKITILTTNYLPFQFKYDQKQKPHVYSNSAFAANIPIHESFWDKSLVERIGERMYDRLVEVSEFINFMSLPSYRKVMAREFLTLYTNS